MGQIVLIPKLLIIDSDLKIMTICTEMYFRIDVGQSILQNRKQNPKGR